MVLKNIEKDVSKMDAEQKENEDSKSGKSHREGSREKTLQKLETKMRMVKRVMKKRLQKDNKTLEVASLAKQRTERMMDYEMRSDKKKVEKDQTKLKRMTAEYSDKSDRAGPREELLLEKEIRSTKRKLKKKLRADTEEAAKAKAGQKKMERKMEKEVQSDQDRIENDQMSEKRGRLKRAEKQLAKEQTMESVGKSKRTRKRMEKKMERQEYTEANKVQSGKVRNLDGKEIDEAIHKKIDTALGKKEVKTSPQGKPDYKTVQAMKNLPKHLLPSVQSLPESLQRIAATTLQVYLKRKTQRLKLEETGKEVPKMLQDGLLVEKIKEMQPKEPSVINARIRRGKDLLRQSKSQILHLRSVKRHFDRGQLAKIQMDIVDKGLIGCMADVKKH